MSISEDQTPASPQQATPPAKRALSPAAQRALAEADARRQAKGSAPGKPEREIGGRGGVDPARYGDWEIKGRAIDF